MSKYNYLITDDAGRTIASGQSNEHSIDEADRLVIATVADTSEIIESSRDKQEAGCWCYNVSTNVGEYSVEFR